MESLWEITIILLNGTIADPSKMGVLYAPVIRKWPYLCNKWSDTLMWKPYTRTKHKCICLSPSATIDLNSAAGATVVVARCCSLVAATAIFCLNPHTIHGDMKENVSGFFFLNTVYIGLQIFTLWQKCKVGCVLYLMAYYIRSFTVLQICLSSSIVFSNFVTIKNRANIA